MIKIYSPTNNVNDLRVYLRNEDLTKELCITSIIILPNEQIKVNLECIIDKIDINNKKDLTK